MTARFREAPARRLITPHSTYPTPIPAAVRMARGTEWATGEPHRCHCGQVAPFGVGPPVQANPEWFCREHCPPSVFGWSNKERRA